MRLQEEIESVSAPEDFLPNFRSLSALDTSLRCPICKDFFVAPVLIHIAKCCHTFCSVCIRACFNQTSNSKIGAAGLGGVGNSQRCPICKTEAHEEKIKPVPALESVVTNWKEARLDILNMASQADRVKALLQSANSRLPLSATGITSQAAGLPEASNFSSSELPETNIIPDKGKAESLQSQGTSSGMRVTRPRSSHQAPEARDNSGGGLINTQASKKRKTNDQRASKAVPDSDSDIEMITGDLHNPATMLPCPVCDKLLRNSDMNSHLDKCLAGTSDVKQSVTAFAKSGRPKKAETRRGANLTVPEKKIPLPHFKSLKMKDFKALLQQHHLSCEGTTDAMTRRLNRYILLHNASLDSERVNRKSLKEIRDELDKWETLNEADDANKRKLLNNKSEFAVQQIVGKRKITITSEEEYLKKNKEHFAHLTTQAASSMMKTLQPVNDEEAIETSEPDDPTIGVDETGQNLAKPKIDNQTIEMAAPNDQNLDTAENDQTLAAPEDDKQIIDTVEYSDHLEQSEVEVSSKINSQTCDDYQVDNLEQLQESTSLLPVLPQSSNTFNPPIDPAIIASNQLQPRRSRADSVDREMHPCFTISEHPI